MPRQNGGLPIPVQCPAQSVPLRLAPGLDILAERIMPVRKLRNRPVTQRGHSPPPLSTTGAYWISQRSPHLGN